MNGIVPMTLQRSNVATTKAGEPSINNGTHPLISLHDMVILGESPIRKQTIAIV